MTAQLKVEGQVVASGGTYTLGQELVGEGGFTQYDFSGWDLSTDGTIVSGQTSALGLSLQGISASQLSILKARLEQTKAKLDVKDVTGLTGDLIAGDILTATVWSYFASVETYGSVAKRQANMIDLPALSYGFFHAMVVPIKLYGIITTSVKFPGVMMDIGHLRHNRLAQDGDVQAWINYNRMRGQQASMLEGAIPETFFTDPNAATKPEGVSAVKAIAVAAAQGQKIFTITQTNAAVALPQLQQRASVMEEIQNAITAGKEVTVSQTAVTVGGWTGSGYIIVDPASGSGAYMIEGGANGGFFMLGILYGALFVTSLAVIGVSLINLSGGALLTVLAGFIGGALDLFLTTVSSLSLLVNASDVEKGCFYNGFAQGVAGTVSVMLAPFLGLMEGVVYSAVVTFILSHLTTTPTGQCLGYA